MSHLQSQLQFLLEQSLREIHCADAPLSPDAPREFESRIHTIRKTGKRTRALLDLIQGPARSKAMRAKGWIRDAARELSAGRDAHVLLLTGDRLSDLLKDQGVSARSLAWFERQTAEIHARTTPSDNDLRGNLTETRQALERSLKLVNTLKDSDNAQDWMSALTETYCRGRQGVCELDSDRSRVELYHEVRKATKRLLYQSQFVQKFGKISLQPLILRASELEEAIGDALDVANFLSACARETTARQQQQGPKGQPTTVQRHVFKRVEQFRDECLARSAALAYAMYFRSPKEFRRSIDG